MATLFVRHEVSNFDKWKIAYDDFDTERKMMGVTDDDVFQSDDNPNDVTIFHEFDTVESAKSFVENPRLREVMQNAGVAGPPTIWFANRV